MEEEEFKAGFKPFSSSIDFKTNPGNISSNKFECEKCKDTGIVKEADGSCHTCWDCLREGRLDCHSKNLPDAKIKL